MYGPCFPLKEEKGVTREGAELLQIQKPKYKIIPHAAAMSTLNAYRLNEADISEYDLQGLVLMRHNDVWLDTKDADITITWPGMYSTSLVVFVKMLHRSTKNHTCV